LKIEIRNLPDGKQVKMKNEIPKNKTCLLAIINFLPRLTTGFAGVPCITSTHG